jgi:hypothetical protein
MAGRATQLGRLAKRAWPLVLEAYRRWDNLSPEEKERYKRQVRGYAKAGRDILVKGRETARRGGRGSGRRRR